MPKMLGPVAKYHESHRWAALDLLWELALYIAWKRVANNQFHPLAVIADVLKPDLDKPVAVALDAAKWLRRKLEDPTAKEMIAGGLPVYTTLLGACLARLISWSRFEGGVTFSYGEAPVNTSIVEPVHRVAYEIIEQEIRIGPWNRAVKIWPVIQKSMLRGISKGEAGHGLLPKDWISARHEGIRLTKLLLEQHPHPWVRFTLKQHLLDSVRWDCTDDLTPDLCAIRASIFEDRDTRTITACRRESQWKFVEDTELGDDYAERLKRSEERWLSFLNDIACELADSQGALLREHLERIATTLELVQEQMHPQMLFHSLTTVRPQAAIQLASRLLQDGTASPLVDCWPVLVMDNTAITPLGQIDIARGFVHSGIPDARPAFFRHWTLRRRDIEQPNLPLNELLIEAAREASDEEALHILYRFKLIESKAFPWAWTLFETLPLERLVLSQVDEVFDALHRGDDETIEAPIEVVARVVKALRDISTWDSVVNAGHVHWLTQRHPRLLFDILFERIKHAEEQAAEYYPEMLPGGFGFTLSFDNLSGESDFPAICDSLWERVLNLDQPRRYDWIKLFQAVVLSASSGWLPRLMWCVKQADTEKTLSGLADILRFDGSMIVINEPALTREFLLRAESLGGAKLALDMRTELYASAGPKSWSFTDGARDDGYGYLESEARKAAETHANDDVLGPFYRWITEREEKDRLHMRLSYEAESAEMDL